MFVTISVYSIARSPSRESGGSRRKGRRNMNAVERFLKYVTYDTQSDEHSQTVPSTEKQKVLGAALA